MWPNAHGESGAPVVEGVELVAVGTSVTGRPPHRSVRAHFSAYGSYLRYLASKRAPGSGCRIRAEGK